jgi:hypothetical protein
MMITAKWVSLDMQMLKKYSKEKKALLTYYNNQNHDRYIRVQCYPTTKAHAFLNAVTKLKWSVSRSGRIIDVPSLQDDGWFAEPVWTMFSCSIILDFLALGFRGWSSMCDFCFRGWAALNVKVIQRFGKHWICHLQGKCDNLQQSTRLIPENRNRSLFFTNLTMLSIAQIIIISSSVRMNSE